jgi:hypothetical protein
MLLQVVDHFSAARMGNPESNVRAIQAIAFQQRMQCAFYQRACQAANLVRQNDSHLLSLCSNPTLSMCSEAT